MRGRSGLATGESWEHLPPPAEREPLGFEALFNKDEAEQLKRGFIPDQMEDKWFIYFEDGWLRFHRSWTGVYVYALCLGESASGMRVIDSWVNRDREQYAGHDIAYDRRLVRFLIDACLLGKHDSDFPVPGNT